MKLNFLMVQKHRFPNLNCFSPDSSENPFVFSFKKQKIVTYSGRKLRKKITGISFPKTITNTPK